MHPLLGIGRRITTFSGRCVSLADFRPEDVRLCDVVQGLGTQVRYVGQARRPVTIAEHSVGVAAMMAADGHPVEVQRCALLHDAAEAYIGDFPSPLKDLCPEVRVVESRIERSLCGALGLPDQWDPVWVGVKRYDVAALHVEVPASWPADLVPEWIEADRVPPACRGLAPRSLPDFVAVPALWTALRAAGVAGDEDGEAESRAWAERRRAEVRAWAE